MKLLVLLAMTMFSVGCGAAATKVSSSVDLNVSKKKTVEVYSGGVLIKTYIVYGAVLNNEGSDGYYFYEGKDLIIISGDIIIRTHKNEKKEDEPEIVETPQEITPPPSRDEVNRWGFKNANIRDR